METRRLIGSAKDIRAFLQRKTMETRVALSVRSANLAVERAFRVRRGIPVEKVAVYSGAAMVLVFMVISYTFASATLAHIPPTPVVTALKIAPAEPVAPTASEIAPAEPVAPTASEIAPAEPVAPAEPEIAPAEPEVRASIDFSTLPKPSFTLPAPNSHALYTLVVDKYRKEVFVLEENRDNYRIVSRYPASLGSVPGDKQVSGDNKTPEGLYHVTKVSLPPRLPGKYGPMAFVLNYPNKVDIKQGKTGHGIWIHGSGLGADTDSTEGCVEINDLNIKALAEFVEVGTPVFIFPENFEIPVINNTVQKNLVKPDTLYSLKENRNLLAGNF